MRNTWIEALFEQPGFFGKIEIGMAVDDFLELIGRPSGDRQGDKWSNLAYIAKRGQLKLLEIFVGGDDEISWSRIGLRPLPCTVKDFMGAVPDDAVFVEHIQSDMTSHWLVLYDQNGVGWIFEEGILKEIQLRLAGRAAPVTGRFLRPWAGPPEADDD